MFRSLRYYNFRLWIAGLIVSNLGTWMQRTAQDWIVLTELTDHDAVAVGLATALQFAPQLLLAGITGTVSDRVDKRKLLFATQTAMALLAILLAVLALLGVLQLWMLLGLSLALGVATAFDIPARQAFVVQLVQRKDLSNAVALNSSGFNVARLVGPGLAGLLVAALGAGWVFALNAASFIAVLLSLLALRMDEVETIDRGPAGRGHFRRGLAYMRSRGDLLTVSLVMFLFGVIGFNMPIITATMTSIEFGQGAEVFGIMGTAVAIGSLAGTLLVARQQTVRLRTLVIAAVANGAANLLIALAPSIWLFAAALVPTGLAMMLLVSNANAYVQVTTPVSYLGRVLALYTALFIGATPLGSLLAGGIANAAGPRWVAVLASVAGVLAAVILSLYIAISRGARLGWDPDRRWRLTVRYSRAAADPETAAEEIALTEAEAKAADETDETDDETESTAGRG